ncbi:hypothetical protein [Metabacillus sp. 113a]|uniref:hypothetical protein n=1 Tax=Metabacillus sp. 113a TaxID=3404706 RepID=UPI003CEAF320
MTNTARQGFGGLLLLEYGTAWGAGQAADRVLQGLEQLDDQSVSAASGSLFHEPGCRFGVYVRLEMLCRRDGDSCV